MECVFKTRWLTNIHLDVVVDSKGKEESDSFWPSYRSKGFIIVYPLFLSEALNHKPGFILDNYTPFINFVFEDPLYANWINILWQWYKFPYLLSFKLKELFLHGFYPTVVF